MDKISNGNILPHIRLDLERELHIVKGIDMSDVAKQVSAKSNNIKDFIDMVTGDSKICILDNGPNGGQIDKLLLQCIGSLHKDDKPRNRKDRRSKNKT